MSDHAQSHPRLPEALAALRRCGYAVGQPAESAQGNVMVTVAGKVMSQQEIFRLAAMDDAAYEVATQR